jgi:hypothetical protein
MFLFLAPLTCQLRNGFLRSFMTQRQRKKVQRFSVKCNADFAEPQLCCRARHEMVQLEGETADEAVMKTCFACHEKAKVSDLVFTHYAPEAQNVYLADPPYGNGKCQKTWSYRGAVRTFCVTRRPCCLAPFGIVGCPSHTQSCDRFIGASIKAKQFCAGISALMRCAWEFRSSSDGIHSDTHIRHYCGAWGRNLR